jgi:hypothetical protein
VPGGEISPLTTHPYPANNPQQQHHLLLPVEAINIGHDKVHTDLPASVGLSSMATASDILSIEIVLCEILRNLPPADILVCRRVCKYFDIVINTSRDVKYAFYLPIPPRIGSLPDTAPRMKTVTDLEMHAERERLQPIFEAIEARFLADHTSDTALSVTSSEGSSSKSYTFNPLLEAVCPRFFNPPDTIELWKRWDSLEEHRAAFMRKGASWTGMTLTQPPVTSLAIVHIEYSETLGKSYRYGSVVIPDGLTMGVLFAYVCKHLARPFATFAIDWEHIDEQYEISSIALKTLYPMCREQGKTVDISDFQVKLFCVGQDDDDYNYRLYQYDNARYNRQISYGQKWLAKWTPEGDDMLKDVRITGINGQEMAANEFMNPKNQRRR